MLIQEYNQVIHLAPSLFPFQNLVNTENQKRKFGLLVLFSMFSRNIKKMNQLLTLTNCLSTRSSLIRVSVGFETLTFNKFINHGDLSDFNLRQLLFLKQNKDFILLLNFMSQKYHL